MTVPLGTSGRSMMARRLARGNLFCLFDTREVFWCVWGQPGINMHQKLLSPVNEDGRSWVLFHADVIFGRYIDGMVYLLNPGSLNLSLGG